MLEGIICVGFDLDGTLYKLTDEMNDRIRIKISEKILEKLRDVSDEEMSKKFSGIKDVLSAKKYFDEEYKQFQSGSAILKNLGFEDHKKVMERCLSEAEVVDLIQGDSKLVDIINEINGHYAIYLITSSPKNLSIKKLEKIGISPSIFSHAIYGDEGFSKGSSNDGKSAFTEMLKRTKIEPEQHLYIGDRKTSDILPAQHLGMKTASVWETIPEADYHISHIHDVGRLLI